MTATVVTNVSMGNAGDCGVPREMGEDVVSIQTVPPPTSQVGAEPAGVDRLDRLERLEFVALRALAAAAAARAAGLLVDVLRERAQRRERNDHG